MPREVIHERRAQGVDEVIGRFDCRIGARVRLESPTYKRGIKCPGR
jgi:hypothetical protein